MPAFMDTILCQNRIIRCINQNIGNIRQRVFSLDDDWSNHASKQHCHNMHGTDRTGEETA